MFIESKEVNGECNALLFIADDYGDNSSSIRCQRALGHEGLHEETFEREGGMVTITWVTDERKRCDHGCGQWKHAHADKVSCPKYADDHQRSDCAFCHPGEEGATCAACGKMYYYARGHMRHCAGLAFTCFACGASGLGVHACPQHPERLFIDGSSDDDLAEES